MSLLSGTALVTGSGEYLWPQTYARCLIKDSNYCYMSTGSGIGRELSLAYVRAGIQNITLADINLDGVAETAKLIEAAVPGTKILQIAVNVTNESDVNAMVDKTVSTFGSLDCGQLWKIFGCAILC